jgi:hypothetical protein
MLVERIPRALVRIGGAFTGQQLENGMRGLSPHRRLPDRHSVRLLRQRSEGSRLHGELEFRSSRWRGQLSTGWYAR